MLHSGKYTNDYRKVAGKKLPTDDVKVTLEKTGISGEECAFECSQSPDGCSSFEFCETIPDGTSSDSRKKLDRSCKFTTTEFKSPKSSLVTKSKDNSLMSDKDLIESDDCLVYTGALRSSTKPFERPKAKGISKQVSGFVGVLFVSVGIGIGIYGYKYYTSRSEVL